MVYVNLSMEIIRKEVDDVIYLRGMKYYSKGSVLSCDCSIDYDQYNAYKGIDNKVIFHANVAGSMNNIYSVEVGFDEDGDLEYYSCDCPVGKKSIKPCKHIVAVLIHILKNNITLQYNISDISHNNFTNHKNNNKIHTMVNDYEYDELIKLYSNNLRSISKDNNQDKIKLEPTLKMDNYKAHYLGFKIGYDKLYVVKDIYSLFEDINDKRTVTFGKNTELNLDINNFDLQSQSLIQFLVSKSTYLYNFTISRPYNNENKLLRIENNRIDDLYDFFENKEIYSEICKSFDGTFFYNSLLKFQTEDIKIVFNLSKYDENLYVLRQDKSNQRFIKIETARYTYIISDGYYRRCSENMQTYVLPVLKTLGNKNNEILIPRDKYSVFYSTVISQLQRYATVNIDKEILDKLQHEELLTNIYIDVDKDNSIIVDVIFEYGDKKVNCLDLDCNDKQNELNNVTRDIAGELAVIDTMEQSGFIKKDSQYILSGEDNIYDFISEKINNLFDIGYVNVTDEFTKIDIKTPKSISMGVRLNNNLLDINLEDIEFDKNELKAILEKYKQKKKYYRLKDGSFVDLKDEYFSTINNLIDNCDITEGELASGTIQLPRYRALYIDDLIKNTEALTAKRSIEFKNMVNNLTDIKENNFDIPDGLNANLRAYQKTGFKWLKILADNSMGGILADDMGLGKTLQVITLLLKQKQEEIDLNIQNDNIENSEKSKKKQFAFIVTPASLLYNWQAEFDKFAPKLTTMIISGGVNQRRILLEDLSNIDVVITSYDLIKRDVDIYKNMSFRYCVIDEAQYIKNSYTQNSVAVKTINSDVRFALTGTPIENSLSDLWSIFDFIMPGFLLSYKKFKDKYEIPIIKNNDDEALKRLNTQIKPFILRRVKQDVLKDLPDKIETVRYAKMDKEQKMLYTAELLKFNNVLQAEISEKGFEKSQIIILSMLTRLRQLCCHPSLYIENYRGGSTKLDLCMETVHQCIDNCHKILIFSQFTSMLDIIASELEKDNIEYYMLTGDTKVSERLNMTNKFNKNKVPVFLISLKAGGTGLNLVGADVVIHYDPWWNTSAQNQATDRTHRIGQVNKVNVIKLIVKDSIEEKIELLQQKKQSLIDSVITKKEVMLNSLSQEEIKNLFS